MWLKPNTASDTKITIPKVKNGRRSVKVCGCISRVEKLIFIGGIVDKRVYLNILKNIKNIAAWLGLGTNCTF